MYMETVLVTLVTPISVPQYTNQPGVVITHLEPSSAVLFSETNNEIPLFKTAVPWDNQ